MISHKYKFIHIHIPKCAGSSIEKVFGHLDGHIGRNGQDHRTIRMIERPCFTINSISSISNLKELLLRLRHKMIMKTNPKNHENVTADQFKNYFKFTVVRNPYSRIFSWYRRVIKDEVLLNYYKISENIEFHDYLNKFLNKKNYMIRPQVYWLKNFEGKINLDYIGKFEEIEKVFKEISKYLSTGNINFPHEKKTKKINYKDYYNTRTKDLVTNFYKDDLKTFNYTFD